MCIRDSCKVGCDCDRYVEFWNLVFTQFDKDEDGNYNKLAHPNIDTGMGLERIACIMQGVTSIFEVDTIRKVLDSAAQTAGIKYGESEKNDVSLRVDVYKRQVISPETISPRYTNTFAYISPASDSAWFSTLYE